MEEFLEYVIGQLIQYPDELVITKTEKNNHILLQVAMRPSDLARITGRGNPIPYALRSLLQAAAKKRGKRVSLEFTN